jgi:hypothetical protein
VDTLGMKVPDAVQGVLDMDSRKSGPDGLVSPLLR